ncbi:MAG TPA: hypothetical protein VMG12_05700, partial [Polyangiaceae bacterium]|nr:hypothetical protein [Polyangiaceae bacterium]
MLPHSLFLVPGYGAQGGSLAAALRGFVRSGGSTSPLEGGMVSSSRGILFGGASVAASAASSVDDWKRGFLERLEAARREVADGVAGA